MEGFVALEHVIVYSLVDEKGDGTSNRGKCLSSLVPHHAMLSVVF